MLEKSLESSRQRATSLGENSMLKSALESQQKAFINRHIGPDTESIAKMLQTLQIKDLQELITLTIPSDIRLNTPLKLEAAKSEDEVLKELKAFAKDNQVFRSLIGMGYYGTLTPGVILRNVLEDPGWYTQYTPYQAEISQGRLEALVNFQTMVMDLTGFDLANASMLDEGTAAAEAMTLLHRISKSKGQKFFVASDCHPQSIAVVKTRAIPLDIQIVVDEVSNFKANEEFFGALVQYPGTYGEVLDLGGFCASAKAKNIGVVVATDLLALTLLKPPAEFGADVAIGSAQRFGVSLGFGGPHAAFIATKSEHKRQIPGRIAGISKDRMGKAAYRLALQTREQHIRRDKASSNICTAQVLLAVMASMYAVYHGPKGLKQIAERVNGLTSVLAGHLAKAGFKILNKNFFDTLTVEVGGQASKIIERGASLKINFRVVDQNRLGVSLDEESSVLEVEQILEVFTGQKQKLSLETKKTWAPELDRTSSYLAHEVFNSYHSEHEMLRYINRLKGKDLSLTASMIPLGSCTMKLNATMEMLPVTWDEFAKIHPFAPPSQTRGYQNLFKSLEGMLSEITGFAGISLQPNAGSQGEYAGLLAIKGFHESRGQGHRKVCLIPQSAHGTNPASAVMAGMKVVVVACDERGNVDLVDLKNKASEHKDDLAALMVTYPSTHGVFETKIQEICDVIHKAGGQVYMDGANMNAQVGLCRPADYGADVLHLNLHKTFCIPHGGGGPGMGPIGVQKHLIPFLPSHPLVKVGGELGPVSAAPWGSASILPISWAYIRGMGQTGVKLATEVAILNANYIAKKLDPHYPVLYKGEKGFVAHECIIDLRKIKETSGVDVEDVAKRLMDYGFHAPTISFPVPGTMMIEPTESESLVELERFCEAMIKIREEISHVETEKSDRENNILKNAPHTVEMVTSDKWSYPYAREQAAYPVESLRRFKFWPAVARIDNAYGDRNLVCACLPVD